MLTELERQQGTVLRAAEGPWACSRGRHTLICLLEGSRRLQSGEWRASGWQTVKDGQRQLLVAWPRRGGWGGGGCEEGLGKYLTRDCARGQSDARSRKLRARSACLLSWPRICVVCHGKSRSSSRSMRQPRGCGRFHTLPALLVSGSLG